MKLHYTLLLLWMASLCGDSITVDPSQEDPNGFCLTVEGSLRECPVVLIQEFVSGKISTTPAYVRDDGSVAKLREGYPTLSLTFNDLLPGEPVVLNILPCDRTRFALKIVEPVSVRFVPQPLTAQNDSGAHLSCELVNLRSHCFCVKLNGLKSSETVFFQFSSESEARKYQEISNDSGEIEMVCTIDQGSPIKAFNSRIGTLSVQTVSKE